MASENPPATTNSAGGLPVYPWSAQTVFEIVSEPFRCQIIGSLASGKAKTAAEINAASGRKRHAYLKHLSLMLKKGFLVQKENPKDRRQVLYALHPSIVVRRTENMNLVDLRDCLLRFPLE